MSKQNSLRHVIQRAGHEYLALILMVAAASGSAFFFLGKYMGAPPLAVVLPIAGMLALSIEWATLTFGQDMQDALTTHQNGLFLISMVKALIAYGVSVFMMANAASVVWAPLDNLLGIDTKTWAWALAITTFGVQFLLKLTPERPEAAKRIDAVLRFVAEMAPDVEPEEQVKIAARMLGSFAPSQQITVAAIQQPAIAPEAIKRPATQAPALAPEEATEAQIYDLGKLYPDMFSEDNSLVIRSKQNGHQAPRREAAGEDGTPFHHA